MVNDRGQLLLIGAITVAIAILGTVVMLNDLQYVDAAGASAETDALDDAERTEAMVERDLTGLVNAVWNDDPANPQAALERNITTYSNYSRNMTAPRGYVVNTSLNTTASDGFEVTTSSPSDHFHPASGNPNDWIVTADAGSVPKFEVRVRAENTLQGCSSPPTSNALAFRVTHDGGSEHREVRICDSGSPPTNRWDLRIFDSDTGSWSTLPACADTNDATIDLVGGTARSGGGTTCTFTGLLDGVDAPYRVEVFNGNSGKGGMTVWTSGTVPNGGSGLPVNPAVDVKYRSPDASYNRTIVIESGGSSP